MASIRFATFLVLGDFFLFFLVIYNKHPLKGCDALRALRKKIIARERQRRLMAIARGGYEEKINKIIARERASAEGA